MKILVTGGTGFIGSHLVGRLIGDGHDVVCLSKDRLNAEWLEGIGASVVMGDLTGTTDWGPILEGVEVVYHAAGITRARWTDDYYRVNHEGTKRFLDTCLRYAPGLGRFVYISSQTAAGPSRDGVPLTETCECRPVSHYGLSKLLAEGEVRSVSDRVPVTIIRPAAVYGPRERDMLSIFQIVRRGIRPVIGFRPKKMNIVFVEDLVDGIVRAAGSARAVGETFFIGAGESVPSDRFARVIAEVAGRRTVRVTVPHVMAYTVGAVSGAVGKIRGCSVLFNVQKAREAVQREWSCSIEKAREHFGYAPRVSLEEGVRRTLGWYREAGWIGANH
jgi:dihydroflavonol-4-reductase